ncbi:LytR cell envelope-related transcriptional attenuator [Blastococcus sp. DSM 46786]|nr:LytR cell envelope-related transcriptional attenuator [Blastococcus sp. DSM 46786]
MPSPAPAPAVLGDVPAPVRAADVPAPVRAADVVAPRGADAPLPGAHLVGKVASPTGLLVDDEPLASTGPARGLGRSAPAPRVPRVPRQTTPSGAPSSSYGDWTKPSRTDETGRSRLGPALQAPATTAIPERGTAARRDDVADLGYDDFGYDEFGHDGPAYDDAHDLDAELAATAAGAAKVKGGRAAYRAERQAADAARRKAAKRNGTPEVIFDDEPERKPRRVLKGLVAMAVVAGAVLGVYTVTAPEKEEAAATSPPASAPTVAVPTAALPPLPENPVVVEPVITTPVRVPVTVLNATNISGLAATISGTVVAGGWESPGVGAYPGTDVSATTVFFTEGDEQQRQAALQLVDQFPELAGPAPRFFDVADAPAPGLVIVATGNWQP